MKARKIENRLAILGAIIALIGVSAAANMALAEETVRPASTAPAAVKTARADSGADENRAAADEAAERIARDTELDLEIRLLDRTSKKTARL